MRATLARSVSTPGYTEPSCSKAPPRAISQDRNQPRPRFRSRPYSPSGSDTHRIDRLAKPVAEFSDAPSATPVGAGARRAEQRGVLRRQSRAAGEGELQFQHQPAVPVLVVEGGS